MAEQGNDQQNDQRRAGRDGGPGIVVVGAGLAGAETAAALREQGWRGRLTVLGEEPHRPYDRPPLSKDLLLGKATDATLDLDWAALDADLLLGRRALGLDTVGRTVATDAGPVPYDRLVVATGAEAVPLPGTDGVPGVHLLRTLEDAAALRAELRPGARIAVVGAGWIGAEVTTAALESGCEVTVVEAAAVPVAGALPAGLGERFRPWYAAAGADLRTGCPVESVAPGEVRLADGGRITADAVVVGIGARPATGWLRGSAVELDEGGAVRADAALATTAPGVYAVGDCASFPSALFGTRLTVQHWDNAFQSPRTAAANLLGADGRYDPVPYFWSEQFGRMVQYAGHHPAADELLWRGDPDAGTGWSALWLREGALVALVAVDRPRDLVQGRRLIGRAAVLDRGRAADPAVPLKSATA